LKTPVLLSCAWLAVSGGAAAAERIATPLENDQVKVLDVTVQPHEKTRMHQHKVNRVMVYLTSGTQHFEFEGGKPSDLTWKEGQALWSPAGGMHTAEITSSQPVRIIEVELRKPGNPARSPAGPLDPVKVDAKHYHVEFENDQVRVVRVKIGPGQTAPLHEHKLNRVVIYLTDQNFKVTSADGRIETPQHKSGDVSLAPPGKHTETNISDKPFEVFMIELKS